MHRVTLTRVWRFAEGAACRHVEFAGSTLIQPACRRSSSLSCTEMCPDFVILRPAGKWGPLTAPFEGLLIFSALNPAMRDPHHPLTRRSPDQVVFDVVPLEITPFAWINCLVCDAVSDGWSGGRAVTEDDDVERCWCNARSFSIFGILPIFTPVNVQCNLSVLRRK